MTEQQLRKEIAALYELPSCLIPYFNTDKNTAKSIKIVTSTDTRNIFNLLNTEYFRTPKLNGELPEPALRLERLKQELKVKKAYISKKNYNFITLVVKEGEPYLHAFSESEIKKGICAHAYKQSSDYFITDGSTGERKLRSGKTDADIISFVKKNLRVIYEYIYGDLIFRSKGNTENFTKALERIGITPKEIKAASFLHSIFDKATPVECEFFNTHLTTSAKRELEEAKKEIKIIKGEGIRYYYDSRNYASLAGSLGNSCMRHSSLKFRFDLYCKNNNVEMVALVDKDSNKLKARAILWTIHTGEKVIDRIFSIDESSKKKLITYASHNNIRSISSINGNIALYTSPALIYLDKLGIPDYHPYLDSTHFRGNYFNKKENKWFIVSNLTDRSKVNEIIKEEQVTSSPYCKTYVKTLEEVLRLNDVGTQPKYKLNKDLEWECITEKSTDLLYTKVNNITLLEVLKAADKGYIIENAETLSNLISKIQKKEPIKNIFLRPTEIGIRLEHSENGICTNNIFSDLKKIKISNSKMKLFKFTYWPTKFTQNEVKDLKVDGKLIKVPNFINNTAHLNFLKKTEEKEIITNVKLGELLKACASIADLTGVDTLKTTRSRIKGSIEKEELVRVEITKNTNGKLYIGVIHKNIGIRNTPITLVVIPMDEDLNYAELSKLVKSIKPVKKESIPTIVKHSIKDRFREFLANHRSIQGIYTSDMYEWQSLNDLMRRQSDEIRNMTYDQEVTV